MSDEEEVKEPVIDGEAIPNLDDAFEVEDVIVGEDDLGVLTEAEEDDEDLDTDFLIEDRDGML